MKCLPHSVRCAAGHFTTSFAKPKIYSSDGLCITCLSACCMRTDRKRTRADQSPIQQGGTHSTGQSLDSSDFGRAVAGSISGEGRAATQTARQQRNERSEQERLTSAWCPQFGRSSTGRRGHGCITDGTGIFVTHSTPQGMMEKVYDRAKVDPRLRELVPRGQRKPGGGIHAT